MFQRAERAVICNKLEEEQPSLVGGEFEGLYYTWFIDDKIKKTSSIVILMDWSEQQSRRS